MEYRLVTTGNKNGVFDPANLECEVTQISEQTAYAMFKSVPGFTNNGGI